MTGIVPVDKPAGRNSRPVSARTGFLLGEKKAGHAGTLDPAATGVLPVLLGRACRLIPFLDTDKRYTAYVRQGVRTDTGDADGAVTATCPPVPRAAIEAVLPDFVGVITQTPPVWSALKVNGRALYKYARAGQQVIPSPRETEIFSLTLVEWHDDGSFVLDAACSAGTYIRTLCEDIAVRAGGLASLYGLRRTLAGGIGIERCVTLDEVERRVGENDYGFVIGAQELFGGLEARVVPDDGLRYYLNGGSIGERRLDGPLSANLYRVFASDGAFLGLGAPCPDASGETCIKSAWAAQSEEE